MKIVAGSDVPVTNVEVLEWLKEKNTTWADNSIPNNKKEKANKKCSQDLKYDITKVRDGYILPTGNTRNIMSSVRSYIESSPAGMYLFQSINFIVYFCLFKLIFRF